MSEVKNYMKVAAAALDEIMNRPFRKPDFSKKISRQKPGEEKNRSASPERNMPDQLITEA